MSNASGAKGGLLILLGCVAAVGLVSSWGFQPPPAHSTPTAVQTTVSPAPEDIANLAVQVAGAYKPGDTEEKFRLGARKLTLEAATRNLILHDLDDPHLEPSDPVKNKDALRRILTAPVTTPKWPEEAVRKSLPAGDSSWVLSLSDPVRDPKVPGRYYFLSGRGEEYYDGLGLLTVDVSDDGTLKLQYDIFMSLHPPMKPYPESP